MRCLLIAITLGVIVCQAIELPTGVQDWVFAPGDAVECSFPGDVKPTKVSVHWLGGNLEEIQVNETGKIKVPTGRNGYGIIEWEGGRQTFAVIPSPVQVDTFSSPFGVNFHLDRINGKDGKREIGLARRIGIAWGRGMLIDWSHMQSDDYKSQFAKYDFLFNQAKDSGLNVLGGIHYIPKFASGYSEGSYIQWSRTPPDNLDELVRFGKAIAARCPFVKHWEIGNENDASNFWLGRRKNEGNSQAIIQDYVDFLKAAATGIKQGNPDAKILFAGIVKPEGGTYRPFLETALRMGAREHFDIMNQHYVSSLDTTRSIFSKLNVKPAEIWITEIGSTSGGVEFDEIRQLREDIIQPLEQLSNAATKVFKYDFRNDGTNPVDREHNFGLINRDFSPKPSYAAWATLIRLIQNAKPQRFNLVKRSDKGFVKAFRWIAANGKPMHAIILENANSATVRLTGNEKTLQVFDCWGNSSTLPMEDGEAKLQVNRLPIYVEGDLVPDAGVVAYPEEILARTIEAPFINPSFAQGLDQWHGGLRQFGTITHHREGEIDFARVQLVDRPKHFIGFGTRSSVEIDKVFAELKPGQVLKANVSCKVRLDNVKGRGITLTCDFLKAGHKGRFGWNEHAYVAGSSDWKQLQFTCNVLPGTTGLWIAINVSPGTIGNFDLDEIAVKLEIWQKPGY